MIEIRNAIISNKKAPKEEISFSFDKGALNTISYEEKYKFDFLKLKDQSLEKGEFYIDGIKIYPDENNEFSIFFLAVNSLIKIGLCFLVKKEEKKQKVNDVQAKLIELRACPTNTEEEKQNKILKVLDTACDLCPSYLLIDYNDDVNKELNLSLSFLENYSHDTTIIALSKQPETFQESVAERRVTKKKAEPELETNIAIGEESVMVLEKESSSQKEHITDDFVEFDLDKRGNFFKFVWSTWKKNISLFLSFGVPVIGVISFSLLSPMYARSGNKYLLIPFILTIIICFILHMIMTYRCTNYVTNKNDADKTMKIISCFIINLIITIIGASIGVGIYLLFKNFDNTFKALPFNNLDLILPIILGLLMLTENLFVAYIGDPIVKLFKRKKKK